MPKSSVVSLFDRPRWSVEDARAVLAALDQSGQSVSVFAAEHGLDPQRVYVWRRRLGVGAEATMFREIAVQMTPRTPPRPLRSRSSGRRVSASAFLPRPTSRC